MGPSWPVPLSFLLLFVLVLPYSASGMYMSARSNKINSYINVCKGQGSRELQAFKPHSNSTQAAQSSLLSTSSARTYTVEEQFSMEVFSPIPKLPTLPGLSISKPFTSSSKSTSSTSVYRLSSTLLARRILFSEIMKTFSLSSKIYTSSVEKTSLCNTISLARC